MELLTKDIPYPSIDQMEVALKVSQYELSVDIPTKGPEILRSLIKQCMHFDAKKRPTFEQICEQLEKFCKINKMDE